MAKMDPRKSRGFLNNNPGNMDRAAGEPWQGEIRDTVDARLTEFQRRELNSGRFSVFKSPEWGIRALAKNLFSYRDRLGKKTIRQIIYTWAPPPKKGLVAGSVGGEANGEDQNDSASYAAAVAKRAGVGVDTPVDMRDYKTLHGIVTGIIIHECGGMPYAGDEVDEGLRLAGVPKPATVAASSAMKGAATAATATAAQPILQAVQEPIQELALTLEPMADTHIYVTYALLAVKVLLAAVALYGVWMMVKSRKASAASDARVGDVTTEAGR